MNRRPLSSAAIAALLLSTPSAAGAAESTGRLVELVNEYRTSPQQCRGQDFPAAPPLAPEERLARAELSAKSRSLEDELSRAGYSAARARSIVLTGPPSAQSAMSLLQKSYCETLMDPKVTDIGVSRERNTWSILLARPVVSPDLGDWREAGKEILQLVNQARAQSRACGDRRYDPAPPVRWDPKLAAAALAHSRDMAQRNYFAHEGKGGTQVADRASREGYRWRSIGENIATGQGSVKQVVSGWIASPRHCANIMDGTFTEMGAAYAVNPDSDTTIYWTQVFGTPQR